jgi:short-subunit dehydrogenase
MFIQSSEVFSMQSMVYISGATGGLGRGMAVECASRGWDLFLTDISEARLACLAQGLSQVWGVRVQYFACDMADVDCRTALIAHMQSADIRLHMAIHVAGLDCEGYFLEKSREEILTVMNVNAVSTVDMLYSLTALRDTAQTFRVINVCSLAGMYPMPVKASYAASKSLLINMSLALREEFREINATVTALCPAGMATNEVLLKSMAAQGFAGRITTLEVSTIVAKTIDAAQKGRAVYIPGIVNRALLFFSRLFPATFIARSIGGRWKKTNKAFEALLHETPV